MVWLRISSLQGRFLLTSRARLGWDKDGVWESGHLLTCSPRPYHILIICEKEVEQLRISMNFITYWLAVKSECICGVIDLSRHFHQPQVARMWWCFLTAVGCPIICAKVHDRKLWGSFKWLLCSFIIEKSYKYINSIIYI